MDEKLEESSSNPKIVIEHPLNETKGKKTYKYKNIHNYKLYRLQSFQDHLTFPQYQ